MANATLSRYLRTRYESGGRGPNEFDCYGMTRHGRFFMFGKSLLGEHLGILDTDKVEMTRICKKESANLVEVSPSPGGVATCWRGGLFFHAALVIEVDDRLSVLETNKKTGPRWMPIAAFERLYTRVIYYDN